MIAKDMLVIQQQVYNFLRSVTIKFDPIAQNINTNLIRQGYSVNTLDPTTWKYYVNMQGRYHESDEMMRVISLDTRQEIDFTPQVLESHPRTKTVYQPGGIYYKKLCQIYPKQVDLIKSILFPVTDIQKAIASDDLVLLGYGDGYLEEWEQPIILAEIESFLEIVKERWYFNFLDDEPLFHITFWGSLWTYLAMLIMSKRESLVHTPYVHSWHIWNKLKTKGLDDYSDVLDRKKSMMLYQNIDYLKANAGKQSNLVILANRLLSDFGVSIYGRKIVQESQTGSGNFQLTPQFQAVRIPTDNFNLLSEITSASVSQIQSSVYEKGLTPELDAEVTDVKERKLGDTRLNNFMTKFLEIRPLAKNKIYADVLNMFILETLTTCIINEYYTAPVLVSDQAADISLYFGPKELLAIYHYASLKSIGITPVNIPTQFSFYRSFLTQIPDAAKTIQRGDEKIYLSMHFDTDEFLSGIEYNEEIAYPTDFTEMLTRQWLKYMEHLLADQKTKIGRRGYILEYLTRLCHERRVEEAVLVPGFTTYEEWLGPQGIDIESSILSRYDVQLDPLGAWGSLADSIMTALVPINETLDVFGNFTLSDYGFERLRQLFVQMCSYRVVFLESTRQTPEYALGLKWSNEYGPDHVETFKDRTLAHKVRTTDSISSDRDFHLHTGFCKVNKTTTELAAKYTVTTRSNMGPVDMTLSKDNIRLISRTTSTFSSSGTVNLSSVGALPTGIMDDV